jgi:two-component system, NtrC family, sensor kinase
LLRASKLASVGELAAGVAHEINNPLAVVLSESQVIRDLAEDAPSLDGGFAADLLESLEQIESQVKRCKVITTSLLRFSYCGSGSNEPVDVNWCLENSIFLLEKKAKSNGIRFCVDLAPNLPTLKSDCSQLEQVFINLLNNAIDAHEGKPYGVVNISSIYNPDRDVIEISVADSGSGIAPDILGKIFDPFFTTKTIGKGTGLGLSISYSIVRHLGGKITVDSEVGKGTRFTVSVPTHSAVGA